jgi:hypothetical protein
MNYWIHRIRNISALRVSVAHRIPFDADLDPASRFVFIQILDSITNLETRKYTVF